MASGNDNAQFPSGSHDPFDRIPVEINHMILAHLPITDLLSCGLVSKSWKMRSRSYLKSHRECFAYVKNPCKDLLALNNHMTRSDLSMINGIHIRIENPGEWKDIDVVYCCRILMQYPWKYLYVNMPLEDESECGVILVRSLIRASRLSLNKLSVYFKWLETTFFDFLSATGEGEENSFPKLTVFEFLGGNIPTNSVWYEVLPAIAPRLKHIFGVVTIAIGPMNIWDVSVVKCIKEVSLVATDDSETERNSNSAEQFARIFVCHLSNLRVLRLNCYNHPTVDLHPSMQLQLDILHNNRNTLEELKISAFYLVQYRKRYPTERFPKLKTICIDDYVEYAPNVRNGIMLHLNDSRYFPNVTELAVAFGYDSWPEKIFLELVEEDASINEKPLVLKIIIYDDECDELICLETLFQRVVKIEIWFILNLGEGNLFHWASTFMECPLLEELYIELNNEDENRDYDMDAFLCGINIEEAASILEQHWGGILHLEDLNIVPTRPPITFTRNLKRLRLRENYFRSWENPQRITEVSGYLAFRRMPQVEVVIEGYVSNRDGKLDEFRMKY